MYYVEKPSYIYQQKIISRLYCWGSYNILRKEIVTYDDLIQAAKEFMDKYGDEEYQCGYCAVRGDYPSYYRNLRFYNIETKTLNIRDLPDVKELEAIIICPKEYAAAFYPD